LAHQRARVAGLETTDLHRALRQRVDDAVGPASGVIKSVPPAIERASPIALTVTSMVVPGRAKVDSLAVTITAATSRM